MITKSEYEALSPREAIRVARDAGVSLERLLLAAADYAQHLLKENVGWLRRRPFQKAIDAARRLVRRKATSAECDAAAHVALKAYEERAVCALDAVCPPYRAQGEVARRQEVDRAVYACFQVALAAARHSKIEAVSVFRDARPSEREVLLASLPWSSLPA